MNNKQILLYKNKDGKYIPYDTINKDLCVLYGDKEYILKRVKKTINKYYSDNIDLYNRIESLIEDFYNNNYQNYGIICAYDFTLNSIVPLTADFFVGYKDSILTADEENIKKYVRRTKDSILDSDEDFRKQVRVKRRNNWYLFY